MGTVDSESIYKPRVYKEQLSFVELQEKPEVDQVYIDEVAQRLFRDNRFSIKKINEYVRVLLEHKTKVKSSDLLINDNEDLTRMILIQLYAHHEHMCYRTETTDSNVTKNGIEYIDFMIVKRGEQYGK